jgi:Flp pilus assembly CpaE family ATPase
MLSAFVIGNSKDLVGFVHRSCSADMDLCLLQTLEEYPKLHHLIRLLNGYAPDVVFLEIDPLGTANGIARDIRAVSRDTALIGFAPKLSVDQIRQAADAGIPEILQGLFTADELHRALIRAVDRGDEKEGHRTIAFVSAKGGSGATTIALNVSRALAKRCRKSVLLLEGDLQSGVLSVLLGKNPRHSLIDALGHAAAMNDAEWARLVTPANEIDLLPSTPRGTVRTFTGWDCQRLLGYLAARYESVIVDLPDLVSDLTEPAVRRCDEVYVVCTPERPSLYLAQRRMGELESCGVHRERISIVVNRQVKDDTPAAEIERYLQAPVCLALPDERLRSLRAERDQPFLAESSGAGRLIAEFSAKLAGLDSSQEVRPRFSLVRNVLGVLDRRLGRAHS